MTNASGSDGYMDESVLRCDLDDSIGHGDGVACMVPPPVVYTLYQATSPQPLDCMPMLPHSQRRLQSLQA